MPIYNGEPRTGKRLNKKTGLWEDVIPNDLVAGDIFKMFEPTGEPVFLENGDFIFVALEHPYLNSENNNRVTVKVLTENE